MVWTNISQHKIRKHNGKKSINEACKDHDKLCKEFNNKFWKEE